MKSEKLISVVLATYNGAAFLEKQLASIARQTYSPIELIISDDASTDTTRRIIAVFQATATFRVTVICNPETFGYGQNFLSAATAAAGEFIAFCDQDDLWYPDKLEKCAVALEKYGCDMCVHALNLIDCNDKHIGVFSQGIEEDAVYPALSLEPWGLYHGLSIVFRRSLLAIIPADERGLDCWSFSSRLAHDRWIYFLGNHFGRIVAIAEPLAAYRQHPGNLHGHAKKSIVGMLRARLTAEVPRFGHLADLAAHRVRILSAKRRNGDHGDAFTTSVARWERLSQIYQKRAELYERRHYARKISLFLQLASFRAYASVRDGGIGRRKFLEDLVIVPAYVFALPMMNALSNRMKTWSRFLSAWRTT